MKLLVLILLIASATVFIRKTYYFFKFKNFFLFFFIFAEFAEANLEPKRCVGRKSSPSPKRMDFIFKFFGRYLPT